MSAVRKPRTDAAATPPAPVHRVALVTGANRGLGFEVTRQLAARGYTVLLGARDPAKGRQAAKRLAAGGAGEVVPVTLDVDRPEQVDALAAWIERRHGRLDVLVNNAGGHLDRDARAESEDIGAVQAALDTHLLGAWRLCRALLPLMRRHGYGRIVNVTSGCAGGSPGCIGYPAYRVSKAALNAFTRTLAAELAGSGILVNAVCPGWVATDLGGRGGGPVERGAAGIVWAACLPEPGVNGALLRDGQRIDW